MRRAILIAVALLGFWPSATAAGFYDGNKLMADCFSTNGISALTCVAYVSGVVDTASWWREGRFCLPNGIEYHQAAEVVRLWLSEHPEQWHLSGEVLIREALRETFPCN